MKSYVWAKAVAYLLSHAGRWVPSWELGDFVYSGVYSKFAPNVLVLRARRAGVPIESSEHGYRIGRNKDLVCPKCGLLKVLYQDGEGACYGCIGTEFVEMDVGRAPGAGDRCGKPWTPDEEAFVRAHRHDMTHEEIAELLHRSESSVRGYTRTRQLGRKTYVLTKARARR